MNLHIIPNWLVGTIGLAFYAYAFATGMPMDQIVWHSQICVAAFLLGLMTFMFWPVMGAGAIKLTAVIFLWLGYEQGCLFVVVSYGLLFVSAYAWGRRIGKDTVSLPYLPFAALTLLLMGGAAVFETSPPSPDAQMVTISTQ